MMTFWIALFKQLDFDEILLVRAVCHRWNAISTSNSVLVGIVERKNEIRFRAFAFCKKSAFGLEYHLRTVLYPEKPLLEPSKDPISVSGFSSIKLVYVPDNLLRGYGGMLGKPRSKFLNGTFTQAKENVRNGTLRLFTYDYGLGDLDLWKDNFTLQITGREVTGISINPYGEEDIDINGTLDRVFDRTEEWWWQDQSTPKM